MVVKVNKSILGEDWLQSFSLFRLNPEAFLDKRKLTRDSFCFDVLKELYLDHIEIQNKIHLLLLLQEHSALLIKDTNLLEQVVGSLTNLCNILGTKSDKRLLKSQTLITIVTILLSQNLDDDAPQLIAKVKTLLLETIYNVSEDSTVISTGCKCLEELEEFFPGILESEITNIYVASEQEMSPALQSYILLLSMCVKHSALKLYDESSALQVETGASKKSDVIQISPFVSHLLEQIPYMTHTAVYRVLKNLIFVVKHTPELSPMTFKLYLQNLIMSSDVPLFHLVFDLLEAFGSALVSPQDETYLFKQLMKMSTHPCLSSYHRLLYLDWLKICVVNKKIAYFSSLAHYSDLQILLPAPFDGPLTQEKKSCILGLCVPSNSNENSAWECLNECICGLVKCSLLPGGTKTAPSLFRTLFVYFCFHNSKIMHNSVYRLITGIMKTSPHLTSYALSFLQSVKRQCKDSQFHEKVLGHLVEHILSIPMKQFCSNLEYYLVILESASQESASVCRPRAILRLLQKLLINAELKLSNVWSTGNDILSVCRSFLKYHDVQIFYYDLAEVLCLITQNIDDADVKDRAKIYYSMLTTLSKLKVQTIFSLNSSVKDAKNALSTFVVGGDAFQFACIQKLSHSVLQLVRLEEGCENYIIEKNNAADIKLPDVLDTYQNYLSSHEPTLKVPFVLKHVENVDDTFSELYSIIITTHSEPSSKEISVIEIPILKNLKTSQNKGGVTVLSLKPVEPYPLTLHFKAEFTCNNGCSYTCLPPSLVLNFEDLFMPLPVPESILSAVSSWRQQLFDVLWEEFKLKINSRETKSSYCQSSFCLKTEKTDFFSIVEQKWKAFIVVKLMSYSYNVAVYLPPNNHLLMKLSVVNDKPFVNIIVDNNNTLPWITVCLQNMSGNVIKDE